MSSVGELFKQFNKSKQEILSFYDGVSKDDAITNILLNDSLANLFKSFVDDETIIKEKLAIFLLQNSKKSNKSETKNNNAIVTDNKMELDEVSDEFYQKYKDIPNGIWCSSRMVLFIEGNTIKMCTPDFELVY